MVPRGADSHTQARIRSVDIGVNLVSVGWEIVPQSHGCPSVLVVSPQTVEHRLDRLEGAFVHYKVAGKNMHYTGVNLEDKGLKAENVRLRTVLMPGFIRISCSSWWILSWYSSITSSIRSTTVFASISAPHRRQMHELKSSSASTRMAGSSDVRITESCWFMRSVTGSVNSRFGVGRIEITVPWVIEIRGKKIETTKYLPAGGI